MEVKNRTEAPRRKRKPAREGIKRILLLIAALAAVVVLIVLVVHLPEDRAPAESDRGDLPEESGEQTSDTANYSENTGRGSETSSDSALPDTESPPVTTVPAVTTPGKDGASADEITCDEFGSFTGQYVEDGRDEPVQNVAAVKIANRSARFLDFATVTIDIDGKTATFVVTGLPAGRSAWVLEASRMTVGENASFTYLDCVTSFRDGVTAQTDRVTITADGNMLTATNNTSGTLENVFVYYRRLHSDGNFLGGITYSVSFGTLKPGESVEVLAGHYEEGIAEIVRVGWQDG